MTQVTIVTEGTRGVGEAIALALRNNGYKVAVGYGSDNENAQEFTAATGIPAWKWNAGDYHACCDAISKIEKELGAADVLVINAGITREATIQELS